MSLSASPNSREDNWDICMSLNYLSCERPSGVMFGFLSQPMFSLLPMTFAKFPLQNSYG